MKANLNSSAVSIGVGMIFYGLFLMFGWPLLLLIVGVALVAWGGATQ